MTQVWGELFGLEAIDPQINFFDLGGDSWDAVRMVATLNDLGHNLTLDDLSQHLTISDLAGHLLQSASEILFAAPVDPGASPFLVPLRSTGSRAAIFLMPPLLGMAHPYARLAHDLAPDQPVYALRAAGLRVGEKADESIPDMAARYLMHIRSVQPVGPYRLAGWSLGGWVALEMAHQLTLAGQAVEPIILIDTPYRSYAEHPWRRFRRGLAFARLLGSEIWPFVQLFLMMQVDGHGDA